MIKAHDKEEKRKMNRQKWTALFLAVGLMLYAGAAQGESRPLIYQVTDDAGHMLYLLGTIHVGEESMYPLGDAVERAYQAAEAMAVEVDLVAVQEDFQALMAYSVALMYGPAGSAEKHLSPETYALGVEKLGQSEAVLKRMRPVAWLSLAQEMIYAQIGSTSDWGVDAVLLTRAHQEGKPIEELEGLESQMETLLSMPDALVDFQLQQMLLYPEAAALSMKLMSTAWRQGNEEILALLLSQETAGVPLELREEYAAYEESLLHSRDAAFEEKAIAYLESGKTVLFAVGAAHIVGEGALADRLAQAGYTVEEIGR